MTTPPPGVGLEGKNPFIAWMFTHDRTWLRALAVIAGVLALIPIIVAWVAITHPGEPTTHDSAVVSMWVWMIVAVISCVIAGALLLIASARRLPVGLSATFGLLTPFAITVNIVLLVVAAQWWPSWVGYAITIPFVLVSLAMNFGIFWPTVVSIARRSTARNRAT